MNIEFKINEFEGPLDLLLHLIKESKMDIMNIEIEEITKQYMTYLLPSFKNEEEEEEEDPREELVNRLLEYQAYKEITKVLQEKEELRKEIYTKSPENIKNYIDEVKEVNLDVSLDDLVEAFKKFLDRKKDNKPLKTKVTVNEISVSSRRHDIKRLLKDKKKVSFFELFPVVSKEYVVATFLAILEMAKNKELVITQNDTFDDIICEVVSGE